MKAKTLLILKTMNDENRLQFDTKNKDIAVVFNGTEMSDILTEEFGGFTDEDLDEKLSEIFNQLIDMSTEYAKNNKGE